MPLFQLVIEQCEGFFVRPDLAQPHVALDSTPIKFTIQFGPFFLNIGLGLLLDLFSPDGRLAPSHFDEFRRLLMGRPAGVPRQAPDHPESDPSADDQRRRKRPVNDVALGDQKREVGCAH